MSIEDDIAFLETVPALAPLGRDALRILAIGAESRYVHDGAALFFEGEVADAAFVVQEGSFEIAAKENRAIAPSTVGPRTLIGEMALLCETRRPVTATAREPSTVVRIPRQLFLKMLEGYPQAAQRMREVIATRIEQSARDLAGVRAALEGRR